MSTNCVRNAGSLERCFMKLARRPKAKTSSLGRRTMHQRAAGSCWSLVRQLSSVMGYLKPHLEPVIVVPRIQRRDDDSAAIANDR